jgi:endonuclease YncB( thermonuclease family)
MTVRPSTTTPRTRVTRPTAAVLLALALLTGLLLAASPASAVVRHVDYVVDGDTIRLDSGRYVRHIGIDTPEVGECGYRKAKRKLDKWVGDTAGLANPGSVDDADSYDRLLRYVHASGRDTGLALIRRGLAKARYDSLDGYDHHPRQHRYRRADRVNPDVC